MAVLASEIRESRPTLDGERHFSQKTTVDSGSINLSNASFPCRRTKITKETVIETIRFIQSQGEAVLHVKNGRPKIPRSVAAPQGRGPTFDPALDFTPRGGGRGRSPRFKPSRIPRIGKARSKSARMKRPKRSAARPALRPKMQCAARKTRFKPSRRSKSPRPKMHNVHRPKPHFSRGKHKISPARPHPKRLHSHNGIKHTPKVTRFRPAAPSKRIERALERSGAKVLVVHNRRDLKRVAPIAAKRPGLTIVAVGVTAPKKYQHLVTPLRDFISKKEHALPKSSLRDPHQNTTALKPLRLVSTVPAKQLSERKQEHKKIELAPKQKLEQPRAEIGKESRSGRIRPDVALKSRQISRSQDPTEREKEWLELSGPSLSESIERQDIEQSLAQIQKLANRHLALAKGLGTRNKHSTERKSGADRPAQHTSKHEPSPKSEVSDSSEQLLHLSRAMSAPINFVPVASAGREFKLASNGDIMVRAERGNRSHSLWTPTGQKGVFDGSALWALEQRKLSRHTQPEVEPSAELIDQEPPIPLEDKMAAHTIF